MGWKIPEIKIRGQEVRVPRVPAKPARLPKPPRVTGTSGRLPDFDLTVFSGNRKPKGAAHINVIRELLAYGGDRSQTAEKLGITQSHVSRYIKNIRRLPDAQLQIYAGLLNTTVAQIKNVCADLNPRKNITQIDVIRALLDSGGNRVRAAEKLEIHHSNISQHAKNIRQLSDAQLRAYAQQLNTTVARIRAACANLDSKKGLTPIDALRELLACGGNRIPAAEKLGITYQGISRYAKIILLSPDAQLRAYAKQLSKELGKTITVRDILEVVTPKKKRKINFQRKKEVLAALLFYDGNRTLVSKKLKIGVNAVSYHAKNLRQMPGEQLQAYADQLNTTIEQIRIVCADLDSTKGTTHIEIIKALLASGGSRTKAAKKLGTTTENIAHQAKKIRQSPDAKLREYADQLNLTIERIRLICADMSSQKGVTHLDVVRELIATEGNRKKAADKLQITCSVIYDHIKNIQQLPDAKLREYADKLGTTVERVKAACAPLRQAKGKLFVK